MEHNEAFKLSSKKFKQHLLLFSFIVSSLANFIFFFVDEMHEVQEKCIYSHLFSFKIASTALKRVDESRNIVLGQLAIVCCILLVEYRIFHTWNLVDIVHELSTHSYIYIYIKFQTRDLAEFSQDQKQSRLLETCPMKCI